MLLVAIDLRRIVQNCLLDQLVVGLQTPVLANQALNFHLLLFLEDPLRAYLLFELLHGFFGLDSLLIELRDF